MQNNEALEELSELEDLLAESSAVALDDLDALLGESVKLRDEEAHIKTLRERQKRSGLSKEERDADEARIREWEARREWDTTANVGVFDEAVCSCGSISLTYSHLMHSQTHKEKKIVRQVRATEQIATLPNLVAKQIRKVECCTACAERKGWGIFNQPAMTWEI